jgi:hypothetical protein
MTTIQIQVPDHLARLYKNVDKKILLAGVHESFVRHIEERKKKLKEAQKKLTAFENKYKTDFETFERNFPDTSDHQIHEDWIEWSYFFELTTEIKKEIDDFERASGSAS